MPDSEQSQVPAHPEPTPPEVTELLDAIVGNAIRLAGSEAGLVSTWDAEHGHWRTTSSFGLAPLEQAQIELSLADQLPSILAEEERRPIIGRTIGKPVPRRLLTVPLRSHGRLLGLMCLFQPDGPPALPAPDAEDTEPLSERAEIILQNARLVSGILEEKRWLEAIIRYAADGLLILDGQGSIVGANPAFARLTGLTNDEIRGHALPEIFDVPPVDLEQERVEMTLRVGARRVFEANRAIIRDEAGNAIGAVISLRDITARHEEMDLQNTFFSVISHELKTPIAVIKGYADLLSDDLADTDKPHVRRQMNVIREESERLSRMVENLLEASRIQTGALDLRAEPVALGKLITQVVRRMRTVCRTHKLVYREKHGLPTVLGDWDRLTEVVTNLIDNAIKYSPAKGTIVVTAEPDARSVVVRVQDQGAGVPAAEQERIFDRFERLDARAVRRAKGAGLGLFICKAIVEAHGGRIWFESASGGGAVFAFAIPREWPAELPAAVGFAGLLNKPEEHT